MELDTVISKESWDADDVNFLVKNISALPSSVLERLGLSHSTPVDEPVKDVPVMSGEAKVAQSIIVEQSLPPKKRGRPAKIK